MIPEIVFMHCAGKQSSVEGSGPLLNWLRNNFESLVHSPKLANSHNECVCWMDDLDAIIHRRDAKIILIGHSLGASVILKYLSERHVENEIPGIHLLAPPFWGKDPKWQAPPFTILDEYAKKLKVLKKVHIYHDEQDEVVPFNHTRYYHQLMPQAKVHQLVNHGHYFRYGVHELIEVIKQEHYFSANQLKIQS